MAPATANPDTMTVRHKIPQRRGARSRCTALAVLTLLLAAGGPLAATPAAAQERSERLALHAHTLRHRSAAEAEQMVRGMLSAHGSVSVQEGGNTLVVRDTVSSLAGITEALRRFDQGVRTLRLELMVVRAYRTTVSPGPIASTVPQELVQRLRRFLSYDVYDLVAEAELPTREGETVTYEVGAGYTVRFRVGELSDDGRVKLHDFRLTRRGREGPMIHTNLILFLDKTYSLGFSKSADSPTALMLVITGHRGEPETAPDGGEED